MTRCYCGECTKLDGMRFQGIPGTYQMRLEAVPAAERCTMHEPDPPPCATIDGLPLFDGSLEPVLL